jgi:hypothetical protein
MKEKMKRQLGILLIFGLLLTSCDNDETLYTGDIIVTSIDVTTVDGTPIGQLNVGLFDINVLVTNRFFPDEAISMKAFGQGKVEFKGLNPGNYVVALIESNGFRKTVQVTVGKSVTVDLFK